VSQICCKFEVKFLRTMKKIDLTIRNFLPSNFLEICVLSQYYFAFLIFVFQLHIVYSWLTISLQLWTCFILHDYSAIPKWDWNLLNV